MKLFLSLVFAASVALAEWTAAPAAAAPPAELPASVTALLAKQGLELKDGDKLIAEIWFRSALPAGKNDAQNVSLTNVEHGTLLGAVRVAQRWSDRRGMQVKPGLYTLRYSMFPQNGDHQGVAPQRDFLLMINAADDPDGAKNLDYPTVTKLSMKAAGSPHPLVLSLWKADAADFKPGISAFGEHDQVLSTRIGDTPVSIIILGKAEG